MSPVDWNDHVDVQIKKHEFLVSMLLNGNKVHVPGIHTDRICLDHRAVWVGRSSPTRIREADANIEQYKCPLQPRSCRPWFEALRQFEFVRNNIARSQTRQRTEQGFRIAVSAAPHLHSFSH